MPPDDPKTGDIKPVPMTLSVRARRRNLRALFTAFGLLTVATILTALLVASFGGLGNSTKAAGGPSTTRIRVIAVTSTTPPPTTTTTTVPPTTTTSTSTTLPTTTTKPKVTTTTKPKVTTTTAAPASATVTVDNSHQFCTVTVHLSTGAQKSYPLDAYLSQPGDKYVFTAELGGYKVDVTTTVRQNGKCSATLSHFVRA
jgi:hypothetical protein